MAGLLFLVACWVLPGVAFSQNGSLADSLETLLQSQKPDTSRVNLLNDLAWEYKFDDPDKARAVLDSSISLSRRLQFKKGEATALNFKGVVEDIHGNSDQALEFFKQALDLRLELGDQKGVASLYNNLGNVAENLGDYLSALDYYQRSLRIREELKDTVRIMRAYYNMAIVQESMGNYPEALDYIFKFLEFAESANDEYNIANAWNIIGNIKVETDRLEDALKYYTQAKELHEKLGNQWELTAVLNNIANLKDAIAEERMDDGDLSDEVLNLYREATDLHRQALQIRVELEDLSGQAEIYNNMGYVLKNLGSFYKDRGQKEEAATTWLEAEGYLKKSLAIREAEEDRAGIMEVYNGLADIRRREHKYEEALEYTDKYLQIAREIQDAKFQQNGLKDLARIYYKLGQYKKAYDYRKAYDELRYERFNEEKIKNEERREIAYSDRKKQIEIEKQQAELKVRDAQLKTASTIQYSLLGGAVLFILIALILYNRNNLIKKEKQRSERLLLNILPKQTAEELKKYGKASARRYEAATVIFTDFKGFTQIAESCSPEELLAQLDECFAAFDEIALKHGIEKIKTIGDAWLGVAGLPEQCPDHATKAVNAALEMQEFMHSWREAQRDNGKPLFYCRIGIHSGPVVAGVVGKSKFAYDIWGDTVNIAARMESQGEPNEVNISKATFELLNGAYDCISRGLVKAKNKGELEMYFVRHKRTDSAVTSG
ncbi:MAG: hypothetical protein CMN32_02555 [Saprospirales bacterium]|nr:hypothetical protein [Saprospirales bacterium]